MIKTEVSIEDWYQLLPEDIKVRAIHYSMVENKLGITCKKLSSAISFGFIWRNTEEGYSYWRRIYEEYCRRDLTPQVKEIEDDE